MSQLPRVSIATLLWNAKIVFPPELPRFAQKEGPGSRGALFLHPSNFLFGLGTWMFKLEILHKINPSMEPNCFKALCSTPFGFNVLHIPFLEPPRILLPVTDAVPIAALIPWSPRRGLFIQEQINVLFIKYCFTPFQLEFCVSNFVKIILYISLFQDASPICTKSSKLRVERGSSNSWTRQATKRRSRIDTLGFEFIAFTTCCWWLVSFDLNLFRLLLFERRNYTFRIELVLINKQEFPP